MQLARFESNHRRIRCAGDSGEPGTMYLRSKGPRPLERALHVRTLRQLVSVAHKTVLLVEDNEDNRIIYATALRFAGYNVLEATTGTDGVYQTRTHLPDLVLMDISVPELDGWEATAILKAD